MGALHDGTFSDLEHVEDQIVLVSDILHAYAVEDPKYEWEEVHRDKSVPFVQYRKRYSRKYGMFESRVGEDACECYRVRTKLAASPETYIGTCAWYDCTKPNRYTKDLNVPEHRVLFEGNCAERGIRGYRFHRTATHAAIGGLISPRDFMLCSAYVVKDDGTHIILGFSVTHPRMPEVDGYVRGRVFPSGLVAVPTPQGMEGHYVVHSNIGGSLPGWLVAKGVASNMRPYWSIVKAHLVEGEQPQPHEGNSTIADE